MRKTMIEEMILKNRSYRRFRQEPRVSQNHLIRWVNLARLSPSGRNAQALKFFLSADEETNRQIFPHLAWAGFLTDWPGPEEGERPTGYLLILGDHNIADNYLVDHGIAAQSILLGATEEGFGGCMIMAIKKKELAGALELPDHLEILMVIALGTPGETVKIEEFTDSTRYWRDKEGIHHVPKRKLEDLIIHKADPQ